MTKPLKGSCLCGAVQYSVDALDGAIGNCHCRTCQKAHAAPFAATVRVKREDFHWLAGDKERKAFESTPGKLRHFCGHCGTHLVAEWVSEPYVILRIGSLDSDPEAKPVVHIWVSHKAPWYEITDGLPQMAEKFKST
ncbi:MAG TPA: aldehyde-activating protein [Alphaproteobacteria bacterium]|nr:aldehyde-activating protein [Alphaproteobacteria bacterium]